MTQLITNSQSFMGPKAHYSFHKIPALYPVMKQFNQVHIHFINIYFKRIRKYNFFLTAFEFANSENTALHKTVPGRFKEQISPLSFQREVSSYQGTNLSQYCHTK
jgi:hypothetical protein